MTPDPATAASALHATVIGPDELRPEWATQMLALRRRHMQLGPGVTEAQDRKAFQARLAQCDAIALLLDDSEQVRGMFVVLQKQLAHGGQPFECFNPEYLYVDSDHRGDPSLYEAGVRTFFRLYRPAWFQDRFVVGICFLPSFLTARAVLPDLVLLGQPGLDAGQTGALNQIGRLLGGPGFDPDTGLVRVGLLPKDRRRRAPRSAENRTAAALYETVNPRWQEGHCGVFMAPLDAGILWSVMGRTMERQLRLAEESMAMSAALEADLPNAGGGFDGAVYFRLLAAIVAADGVIHPNERALFEELLQRSQVSISAVDPLCRQARRHRANPLAFLDGVEVPSACARRCLHDALLLAHRDGLLCAAERRLLVGAATRMLGSEGAAGLGFSGQDTPTLKPLRGWPRAASERALDLALRAATPPSRPDHPLLGNGTLQRFSEFLRVGRPRAPQ